MEETRGQSSQKSVTQGSGPDPLAAPEACASASTHSSLLLQTTGGKTTTTAGLGPSPKPASRPQCYQHREATVFVGCHGTTQRLFRGQITLPHVPGTKMRAKALLIPTWLSCRILRPQKGNKTHELANICFYLTVTLREEALGKLSTCTVKSGCTTTLLCLSSDEKHRGKVCSPFINSMQIGPGP